MDALEFRNVLGAFPTGVTVVTSRDGEGAPLGLTVNSFTSVSLDPPLVLVCIDRNANSHDPLLAAGVFTVNVLSARQEWLAARFALEPGDQRFDGVAWEEGPHGTPVLEGVSAWLACSLTEAHLAGDHTILIGHVDDLHAGPDPALVFYRGAFAPPAP